MAIFSTWVIAGALYQGYTGYVLGPLLLILIVSSFVVRRRVRRCAGEHGKAEIKITVSPDGTSPQKNVLFRKVACLIGEGIDRVHRWRARRGYGRILVCTGPMTDGPRIIWRCGYVSARAWPFRWFVAALTVACYLIALGLPLYRQSGAEITDRPVYTGLELLTLRVDRPWWELLT